MNIRLRNRNHRYKDPVAIPDTTDLKLLNKAIVDANTRAEHYRQLYEDEKRLHSALKRRIKEQARS